MGSPVPSHFGHLPPEKFCEAILTFLCMEEMGLCQKLQIPAPPSPRTSSSSSQERGLYLEALWQLQSLNVITKPDCYPLPNMTDVTSNFQQTGSPERILSSSCLPRRHSKDSNYHTFWYLHLQLLLLRPEISLCHLSNHDGRHPRGSWLLCLLHRW